jgi:hypothetical protein
MNEHTAAGPVNDSLVETYKHISRIRELMTLVQIDWARRARDHDRSKLEEPEKSGFAEISHRLATLTYGSEEYEQARRDLGETLKHHYSCNRHHPEHFGDEGIAGMNLFDLAEMVVDWIAASERHIDGNINSSVKIGRKRFGFGDELEKIIRNTIFDIENLEAIEVADVGDI